MATRIALNNFISSAIIKIVKYWGCDMIMNLSWVTQRKYLLVFVVLLSIVIAFYFTGTLENLRSASEHVTQDIEGQIKQKLNDSIQALNRSADAIELRMREPSTNSAQSLRLLTSSINHLKEARQGMMYLQRVNQAREKHAVLEVMLQMYISELELFDEELRTAFAQTTEEQFGEYLSSVLIPIREDVSLINHFYRDRETWSLDTEAFHAAWEATYQVLIFTPAVERYLTFTRVPTQGDDTAISLNQIELAEILWLRVASYDFNTSGKVKSGIVREDELIRKVYQSISPSTMNTVVPEEKPLVELAFYTSSDTLYFFYGKSGQRGWLEDRRQNLIYELSEQAVRDIDALIITSGVNL
jgi:hypothetical protein